LKKEFRLMHLIAYCSPNGSTRHVAEVIVRRLSDSGITVASHDCGKRHGNRDFPAAFRNAGRDVCLWIGSPVYVNHPVPPIDRFISQLAVSGECYAVPFVTWGGVTSGTALYEMASALARKGYTLLGAAKIMAVHSSLWRASRPLGRGHPDENDDRCVLELVERVVEKLARPPLKAISLEALDYQPQALKQEARRSSIAAAKKALPELNVDVDKCLQCGDCAKKCPAQAIALEPFPRIGTDCFICLKCVRECPEDAFPFDAQAMEERLRDMAARINETPLTQIFY
jgi:ferredoxin